MSRQPRDQIEWTLQLANFEGGGLGCLVTLITVVVTTFFAFTGIAFFPPGHYPRIVLALPGLLAGGIVFLILAQLTWFVKAGQVNEDEEFAPNAEEMIPGYIELRTATEDDVNHALEAVEEELQKSISLRGANDVATGRLLKLKGELLDRARRFGEASNSYEKAAVIFGRDSAQPSREAYRCQYLSYTAMGRAGMEAEAAESKRILYEMSQKLRTKNAPLKEYLLEVVAAAPVCLYLMTEYPDVLFIPHPTFNGFYADGPEESLVDIARILPALDAISE